MLQPLTPLVCVHAAVRACRHGRAGGYPNAPLGVPSEPSGKVLFLFLQHHCTEGPDAETGEMQVTQYMNP